MPFDGLDDTPASKLLEQALETLSERSRWCKGAQERQRYWVFGPMQLCMVGAIRAHAADDVVTFETAMMALTRAVRERGWETVPNFNDHRKTTHAMVLDVVREAILLVKCPVS